MNIIQQFEKEQIEKLSTGKEIPDFGPGDTVLVNVKVVEGERTRIQAYEGVCIGRAGSGLNENFTVRKISYGEGVERVFPRSRSTARPTTASRWRGRPPSRFRRCWRRDTPIPRRAHCALEATVEGAKRPFDPIYSLGPRRFPEHSSYGQAAYALRQDLGRPSGGRAAGRDLSHLHRSPSRARGHEPAGIRGAAPHRPQGARAGKDALRGRPQCADHQSQPAQP